MELVSNKKEISNLKVRKDILDLESFMKSGDHLTKDSPLLPLKHTFTDGIYVRELSIPKGMLLVGEIHRHEHPRFLLKGDVTVISEQGEKERIKAPCYMVSPAGTKRVVYAHEDSVSITIHHNPDNIKDMDQLEKIITAKDYAELESGIEQKKYLENKKENCGISSLKKLIGIKSISIKSLMEMAKDNGVDLYPYMVSDGEEMTSIPLPAIVHSENHFDYIANKEDFDFNKQYTGYILLTKESNLKKIKPTELDKIKGETWVSVAAFGAYAATAGLIGKGIQAGAESKTDCGTKCRQKCKNETGTFFSGRNKCKKDCKDKCASALTPQERALQLKEEEIQQKKVTTYWIIAGSIGAIILGIVIYILIRKHGK